MNIKLKKKLKEENIICLQNLNDNVTELVILNKKKEEIIIVGVLLTIR